METAGTPPEWVSRLLSLVEEKPGARIKDSDLRSLGIEPARARRYFLQHFGMTFQAYCRGMRMGRAFGQIREGAGVTDATLESGYESFSGFREAFAQTFGAPPARSRDAECMRITWIESPLGPLIAGSVTGGVCLLEFTDRRMLETQFQTLRRRFALPMVPGEDASLRQLKQELDEYFEGKLRAFDVPLSYPGSPFQERVWKELLRIPYGETRSYEDLARALESPGAVRAVGTANGANRIAIVIPCHRVVNKDGKLGGYGGGLWRKQFLLDLEQGRRPVAGRENTGNSRHPAG
jgi:AraC family transcriptional regulator of adaptative response/methylated-DNA-[protein]-cysteine methyltransferase